MTSNFIPLYLYFFLSIASCFGNDHRSDKRVGIITSKYLKGDLEVAYRIKIAGERLGWNVIVDENEGEGLRNTTLDFSIITTHLANPRFLSRNHPNYFIIYCQKDFCKMNGDLKNEYRDYDGYLLTIDKTDFSNFISRKSNLIAPSIPFYPTAYATPYETVSPLNLTYIVPTWGNRISTPTFQILNKLLSQDGFTKFYGDRELGHLYGEQYIGPLPFNGRSIIDTLQKNGIALVIHSDKHIREKIPSGRIFEAAAASAIIISDQNPFVQTYFGDSIFYINTSLPGQAIFSQIKRHMQTILENPEKALEMAKRAHGIFLDQFTMEPQLLELELMHEQVLNKAKNDASQG